MDPPDDFERAAAVKDLWHPRFNFNGPDQLEYIFATREGELGVRGLTIPFPEHVERPQRRRNFRVDTLTGTRMQFKLKKTQGAVEFKKMEKEEQNRLTQIIYDLQRWHLRRRK